MRFAEQQPNGEYVFDNVRNGLIVGLVGSFPVDQLAIKTSN